jgi:hypothetical protein
MESFETNLIISSNEEFFTAKGLVFGYGWGGGGYAYQSEEIRAATMEELTKIINDKIEDKTIDSGFGFRSVLGAIMEIKIIKRVCALSDGAVYENKSSEIIFYGNLNEEQKEFLYSCFLL